jgi:hypothetical protein
LAAPYALIAGHGRSAVGEPMFTIARIVDEDVDRAELVDRVRTTRSTSASTVMSGCGEDAPRPPSPRCAGRRPIGPRPPPDRVPGN